VPQRRSIYFVLVNGLSGRSRDQSITGAKVWEGAGYLAGHFFFIYKRGEETVQCQA
jgi:hypothetical protein